MVGTAGTSAASANPDDVVHAVGAGVDWLDCATPTRLARHGTALVPDPEARWRLDVTRPPSRPATDPPISERRPVSEGVQMPRPHPPEFRQRAAELAVINEIGTALARQLEFTEICELVGERVRAIFRAPSVSIGLYDEATTVISCSPSSSRSRTLLPTSGECAGTCASVT